MAGNIEEGQTPEEAVHMELQEEIGGKAKTITRISSFHYANGISSGETFVFLATDVEIGEHNRNFMEVMETHLMPISQALDMAKNGEITDGISALALLLCEERLNNI